jgi:hypothetical protein
MTTPAATAHASDPTSAGHRLARRQTLAKIEDLATGIGNGAISTRCSVGSPPTPAAGQPEVAFVDETTQPGIGPVPIAAAETLLSAMREAVRNALRHSGASGSRCRPGRMDGNGHLMTIRDDDGRVRSRRGAGRSAGYPAVHDRAAGCESARTGDSTPRGEATFEITRLGTPTRLPTERQSNRTRVCRPQNSRRQLAAVTWAVVLGEITIGLINHDRLSDAPSFVAMELMCVLIVILLHSGRSLRLPTWAAVTSMF